MLGWIYDKQQASPLSLKATCALHYFRLAAQRRAEARQAGQPLPDPPAPAGHGEMQPARRGCLAGTGVAFISHRGEVFPCGYLPVEAGDVLEDDFADIWRFSPVFAELRDPARLRGKCGACEFKTLCGGCRARAHAQSGDYLGEEPASPTCPAGPAARRSECRAAWRACPELHEGPRNADRHDELGAPTDPTVIAPRLQASRWHSTSG